MMNPRQPRGSALIVAVIVVLVMSVLAVGMIRYASAEVAGAQGGAKREALLQCSEAARTLLLSKLHYLGLNPNAIEALDAPLDGTGGTMRALGGHIDTVNVSIGQITMLPDKSIGALAAPSEIGNMVPLTKIGGTPYRVVVHCQLNGDGTATSGQQLELEYALRFGL